ncbi:MAG TPA: hypothetical protein VFF89_08595 [Sphingobium sp.]|nr:hypothetical protein [Sphingobium sp.]
MPAASYSFVCCDCARQENRPTADLPEDWTIVEHKGFEGFPVTRCPDCATFAPSFDSAGIAAETPDDLPDMFAMHPAFLFPEGHSELTTDDHWVTVFLMRTAEAGYKLCLQFDRRAYAADLNAFLLSADDAERVGKLLLKQAELARSPGTLGAAA